jgi:hypothetical protein
MMDQQLLQIIAIARQDGVVVSLNIADGMVLLAYPIEQAMLVGLGYNPDQAHVVDAESVLKKRRENSERFGAWLPAVFGDGSWFVVQRIVYPRHSENLRVISSDELIAAQELLS